MGGGCQAVASDVKGTWSLNLSLRAHTHTHTHNSQDWLASDHICFSHMPRPQPSTQATSVKKTHSRTTLQEWRGRQCDVHIGSILKSNSLNKSAKQTEFLSGHFVEISKSIRSAESHPL